MKRLIRKGETDVSLDLFIQNSSLTTGGGLTGLVYNAAGLACYYRRGATGAATQLALATQTVGGAHADGGFVEIDATNMPGVYRLDLSDAIIATGVPYASLLLKGAANMAPVAIELQLEGVDVASINANAAAAANLAASASVIYRGTITTATGLTTTTLRDSGLTQSNTDHWAGRIIIFTSGTLAYLARLITGFDPANDELEFETTPATAANGDTYVIV